MILAQVLQLWWIEQHTTCSGKFGQNSVFYPAHGSEYYVIGLGVCIRATLYVGMTRIVWNRIQKPTAMDMPPFLFSSFLRDVQG